MKKIFIAFLILIIFFTSFYKIIEINKIADSFDKESSEIKPKSFFGLKIPRKINLFQMELLSSENKIKAAYSIDGDKLTYLVTDEGLYSIDPTIFERESVFNEKNIVYKSLNVSIVQRILSLLLSLSLYVSFFFILMKVLSKGMTKEIKSEVGNNSIPKITFEDVAGNAEAKENLTELVDCIKNPEKYSKFGVVVPRGTLLTGSPGNGKTLMAKALAGTAKMSFVSVSGSEFVELYAGLGAMRVRELFKKAKKKAPCIIFIDEIDAIGKTRGKGISGGNDERDQTLNQLLTEMDGFQSNEKIMILAATNRFEDLDPALLRPGRFDRHLVIEAPDYKSRLDNLRMHFKNKPLSEEVNLEAVAKMTTYMSGAQLKNIANEAGFFAVRNNHDCIYQKDIDMAFNKILAGDGKKDGNQNLKEKEISSYHEAGHAIIAKMIADKSVPKITIQQTTNGIGGYTLTMNHEDINLLSKDDLEKELMILMGGRAAEEITYGPNKITTGSSNDLKQATKLAIQMVGLYGMGSYGPINIFELTNYIPQSMANNKIEEEVTLLIDKAYNKAKTEISKRKTLFKKIAKILCDRETLYEHDFDSIINDTKEYA